MGKIAFYDKKFGEYDIEKFQNLQNFYLIKDDHCCDIVNDEIERFKFSDCEIDFLQLVDVASRHKKLFESIKIQDDIVRSIKILIKGFDQSLDKFDFDPGILNLNTPYKYAISQDFFEMTIFLEEKSSVVTKFFSSIDYKIYKNGESRHIEFFINSKKIYERII
ncbi:DUF5416 family protein [Campylobacter concisus]|uniref:DUF5416 family protein n=1 Tax=Campylobacter concisus TaxID=199 RepID=UPI000D31235C|nr:DUF5416 family protein [Campylobacter concisus]